MKNISKPIFFLILLVPMLFSCQEDRYQLVYIKKSELVENRPDCPLQIDYNFYCEGGRLILYLENTSETDVNLNWDSTNVYWHNLDLPRTVVDGEAPLSSAKVYDRFKIWRKKSKRSPILTSNADGLFFLEDRPAILKGGDKTKVFLFNFDFPTAKMSSRRNMTFSESESPLRIELDIKYSFEGEIGYYSSASAFYVSEIDQLARNSDNMALTQKPMMFFTKFSALTPESWVAIILLGIPIAVASIFFLLLLAAYRA